MKNTKDLRKSLRKHQHLPFVKPKSQAFYRKESKDKWMFWRLIVERVIPYETAIKMELDEIYEANAALDILIEQKNKAMQKGGKK